MGRILDEMMIWYEIIFVSCVSLIGYTIIIPIKILYYIIYKPLFCVLVFVLGYGDWYLEEIRYSVEWADDLQWRGVGIDIKPYVRNKKGEWELVPMWKD